MTQKGGKQSIGKRRAKVDKQDVIKDSSTIHQSRQLVTDLEIHVRHSL